MAPYSLFSCFGVELEYMLVDRATLDVRPIADRLLARVEGTTTSDVEFGTLAWSNELVLHVIELKTNGPAADLCGLAAEFQAHVQRINALLAEDGACLMPTAMHPWMSPERETRLWPHEYTEVYRTFDRIFDCRGHGWSNLQSTHLNLPFANDEEFGRLHAAIRLLLPILPALTASSPVADGQRTGLCDTRLEYYRNNSRRVPSVAGDVVPEPVFTPAAYETEILARAYRDIAPYDPAGILQHEWLNARGAIARFDRGAIEIRVLDIQECPAADLAALALIVSTLRAIAAERWQPLAAQQAWPVAPLHEILLRTIRAGEQAVIDNDAYLAALGYPGATCNAGDVWRHLRTQVLPPAWETEFGPTLDRLLTQGTLARRIVSRLSATPARAELAQTYRELCTDLNDGRLFPPAAAM